MDSTKQQLALTEREVRLYNKEIQKAREAMAFVRQDLPYHNKARKNQLLGILKKLNRFSNNINGIPNGIVTVRQSINITPTSFESIYGNYTTTACNPSSRNANTNTN